MLFYRYNHHWKKCLDESSLINYKSRCRSNREKKHQRLACLVALARVYSTLIISEVTRDNGRTKIMFLVIVAINVSVSWLSRLVFVISVVLLLEWVSCVVLLKHHCRLLFLTRQKLYVDYVFLRLRFFHYANRELSFKIVHEQWPWGRGKYVRCMATSCSL